MGTKVLKFGGTSVANAGSFHSVFNIVHSYHNEKLIVVLSACAGITDKLMQLSEVALSNGKNYLQILDEIENHHLKVTIEIFKDSELSASCLKSINFILQSLRQLIDGVRILDEITPKVKAEILSYGELLSSNIFYHYALSRGLNAYLLDAREIITTDNYHLNAQPDFAKIEQNGEKIKKLIKDYNLIVTQGFIGNWKKETTLLGRGGSDLSASLFGYSVDADEVQIWTDVDGIMTTDPRVVPSAKVIEKITVAEVAELSFFGAKVLHPETIKPAMMKNIPVKVLNTFNPGAKGTTIVQNLGKNSSESKVKSILLIENCYLITKGITKDSKNFWFYYDLLKENFEKIFTFSFNSNNIIAIAKGENLKRKEEHLEREGFDLRKTDAIAFFGLNLPNMEQNEKEKLDYITETFIDFLASKFYFLVSNHSAILLLQPSRGQEAIQLIHSVLFD